MDRLSVKCVIKKLFFHLNSMKISEVVVIYVYLKLHQVSLNSNEKQKSFSMTHLIDGPFVKGS